MRQLSPSSCFVVGIVAIATIVMMVVLVLAVGRFQRQAGELPTLTGVVTTENMVVLPEGAIIRVALLDVTLENAPALTLREQNILHNGKLPAEFEIVYAAKGVNPEKNYQLEATITNAAGVNIFKSDTPIPVLTQGHPSKDLQVFVQEISGPVVPKMVPQQDLSAGTQNQVQSTAAPLPGQNILTGVLTYNEALLLPAGAVAEIKLVDITIEDAPALEVQKVTIPNPGQKPIPFGLPYYPSAIIESRIYALRAEIRDENGDMMFINSIDYLVITQGRPISGITLVLDYVVKGLKSPLFNFVY